MAPDHYPLPARPSAESQRLLNEVDELCAIFTSSMKKLHPIALFAAWVIVLTCNLLLVTCYL